MNERIRALAEQAEFSAEDLHIQNDNFQKFAELIVRECSTIVDDWVNDKDNGENYPSERIKQYFGVES